MIGWLAGIVAFLLAYTLVVGLVLRVAVKVNPTTYQLWGDQRVYVPDEGHYIFAWLWPVSIPLGALLLVVGVVFMGLADIADRIAGVPK